MRWLAAASLLTLLPGSAAGQRAGGELAGAIARGRAAMDEAMRAGAAPGAAVAVAVKGRMVWSDGFGLADLVRGTPVTTATRFGVGSISKALTLAAAISLADDGLVDLDAPIERYIPDFPHRGHGVTIRRIAAHQSGISDTFANAHYYTTRHFDALADAYPGIASAPLIFEPGTRTAYATGLFTIVGRVLEVAAGSPYPELMRQRVLGPARMRATAPNDPRHATPDRTGFYVAREGGGFTPAPPYDPSFKLPGAGFLATAEDLARFGAALLRPGLLSDRGRREMFTAVPLADGTPAAYALGFQSLLEDGRRLLLQPGGGPGIAGWLAIYPDDDVIVAILANATGAPLGGEVRRAVAAGFLRPPAPVPPRRPPRAPPP